jgi:hypothetical protein
MVLGHGNRAAPARRFDLQKVGPMMMARDRQKNRPSGPAGQLVTLGRLVAGGNGARVPRPWPDDDDLLQLPLNWMARITNKPNEPARHRPPLDI